MGATRAVKLSVRRAEKGVKRQSRRVRDDLRTRTGSMRPLPDFLVIGTQKGGTTSLHDYLAAHPQTAPSNVKEVHYFDRDVPTPLDWYRGHFPLRPGDRQVFETTPRYLFHPEAAERIHGVLPEAKLIALLRNPVERALSNYRMSSRGVREDLGMVEAFEAEEERTARPRTPEQADTDRDWFAYKARGRYAEQLARYFEHFDRDQVLVVRSEDLFEASATTCREVLRFLELDEAPSGLALPRSNQTKEADVPPPARALLERYYEQPNEELADLLGRRLW
ncbi:MAG TPA: sulfotransferase [Acidimicrobiales bacterium]|nr:sulfotransferase [Acidimicrobiales bacterium]